MVRVASSRCWRQRSTDKHFILAVGLVNGLRYWSYENFESATEARHNRRHLAGWFNYLALNEISSGNNLVVRAVYGAVDEFDLVAGVVLHHSP